MTSFFPLVRWRTRSFGTTKREVLALTDWLRCWQVPAVVMEAMGDYWKGPFYRLEAEGFECVLADAKQVRHLPAAPSTTRVTRWLAACFERGAVTSCFVATPEFRIIRLHTRYRQDLTEERTREKQRAEKLSNQRRSSCRPWSPTCTGSPAGHHGPPHRRRTQPQGAGRAGPGPRRRKISELEGAPEGAEFFTAGHAALLAAMLARIDQINTGIGRIGGDRAAAGTA